MLKQLFQRIIMVAAILTVMLCTSSYAGTCRVKERSSHTAGSSANNVCSVYGCRNVYFDWEDDFEDFEDAEDYWDEAWDDF